MEEQIAHIIFNEYAQYRQQVEHYTALAAKRFIDADWQGQRLAVRSRIKLHDNCLTALHQQLANIDSTYWTRERWKATYDHYVKLLASKVDSLAISFFDAVGRLLYKGDAPTYLSSVAIEELVHTDTQLVSTAWQGEASLMQLLKATGFYDKIKAVEQKQLQLFSEFQQNHNVGNQGILQACTDLFYRNRHAYMVGRIVIETRSLPFILCFVHADDAIELNAVLFGEDALKNIFSFSRSYFLMHTQRPIVIVNFLRLLMPSKPEAQLYINLGYQFHGRELLLHTVEGQGKNLPELFTEAPGTRGLVMVVITQRSSEFVIKLIRDECKPPKNTLPEEVHQKYAFVAAQDRVGRLADAQRIDFLRLPRYAFPPALIDLIQAECSQSCALTAEWLVLRSVYVERKLVPLNIFLETNSGDQLYQALLDFGNAIREMAMSNIFAGDLLIKNFGVTPEGRVIFYDYDEIVPVTSCNFRVMPAPANHEQEYENESWLVVKDEDVFPEEWPKFLIAEGPQREFCKDQHADIFRASYWNAIKNMHERGEIVDIQPYAPNL